jgi:hypothetical protein
VSSLRRFVFHLLFSSLQFLHQGGVSRFIDGCLVRLVKRRSVQQTCVTLAQFATDALVSSAHRDRVEHLVGDEPRHSLPIAVERFLVQLRANSFPAMRRQHGFIRPSRGIECDLLPHSFGAD